MFIHEFCFQILSLAKKLHCKKKKVQPWFKNLAYNKFWVKFHFFVNLELFFLNKYYSRHFFILNHCVCCCRKISFSEAIHQTHLFTAGWLAHGFFQSFFSLSSHQVWPTFNVTMASMFTRKVFLFTLAEIQSKSKCFLISILLKENYWKSFFLYFCVETEMERRSAI